MKAETMTFSLTTYRTHFTAYYLIICITVIYFLCVCKLCVFFFSSCHILLIVIVKCCCVVSFGIILFLFYSRSLNNRIITLIIVHSSRTRRHSAIGVSQFEDIWDIESVSILRQSYSLSFRGRISHDSLTVL